MPTGNHSDCPDHHSTCAPALRFLLNVKPPTAPAPRDWYNWNSADSTPPGKRRKHIFQHQFPHVERRATRRNSEATGRNLRATGRKHRSPPGKPRPPPGDRRFPPADRSGRGEISERRGEISVRPPANANFRPENHDFLSKNTSFGPIFYEKATSPSRVPPRPTRKPLPLTATASVLPCPPKQEPSDEQANRHKQKDNGRNDPSQADRRPGFRT